MASLFPLTPYPALRSHSCVALSSVTAKALPWYHIFCTLSMYNFTVGGVQFLPTALFNQLRRGCSTSNGQGVQLGRYIQYTRIISFGMQISHFWISNISRELLPFIYPINPQTLTNQHMYVIWAHFAFNDFYSFPLAKLTDFFDLYSLSFIEYFSPGANTIWYMQFHSVCAKLLLSMVTFFIVLGWQVDFITYLEDFFSPVNLFSTTRLSRGFRDTRRDCYKSVICSSPW